MKKIRYIFLTILVAICLIALGAFWAEARLWPYQLLGEWKDLVALRTQLIRPDPVAQSTFTALELDLFIVGAEVSIERNAGGIYAFDDKVLIMSFRGEFFLYQSISDEKSVQRLDINIDNAYHSFQDFVARNQLDTKKSLKEFRFIDVIYHRQESSASLLVTHHQWHEDKGCYNLRLSKLELNPDQALETVSADAADWQNIYDTVPCLVSLLMWRDLCKRAEAVIPRPEDPEPLGLPAPPE